MVESTMTGRVKTRLEPGGGAVEDWRSGGRMMSDDSRRLECWTWSPLTWRLEGEAAEAGEAERAGKARAKADRWGVGEMGVPTATDDRRRGDVAVG
ncbi:hypothetical protein HAX54_010893, partial [Datura stramonium]|nr:hypothetical protein [Datura stramonium]